MSNATVLAVQSASKTDASVSEAKYSLLIVTAAYYVK